MTEPILDADSRPFWEAARDHRLLLPYAPATGRWHFFPRAVDPSSGSETLEWRPASGRGEIYSFTVARRAPDPAFADRVPYVIALIALDEGVRMLSTLVTDDVSAVRIGQRVEVVFDDVSDAVTLPRFTVVPEPAA